MNKSVLITTKYRGVFFGTVTSDKKLPQEITLKDARNCLYWSKDVGGFLGLATYGPTSTCKIGAIVSEITLYDITSVTEVEKDATKKWREAPCVA